MNQNDGPRSDIERVDKPPVNSSGGLSCERTVVP
jgi:hypothetical protein